MSEYREFAQALAEALGPLYRVSILAPGGEVEAAVGAPVTGRTRGTKVSLPGSDRELLLELDTQAIDQAGRTLLALTEGQGGEGAPRGTFTHLDRALEELISLGEAEIGRPISQMGRREKQRMVRFLDERGAFALRKAVETVADVLGVSRFTVYNYLDTSRDS